MIAPITARIIIPRYTSKVQIKNRPINTHQAMITEEIERELREALAHLYDPDYRPPAGVCALLGCDAEDGALAVQSAVIRAIEDLEPSPNTPASAHVRQAYQLIHSRFVLKLTQEETAERMLMSLSSVRRAQRSAVHTLARVLWERSQGCRRPAADLTQESEEQPPGEGTAEIQPLGWRSQVRQELASLRARDPGSVSDVGETINGVLELARALTSKRGVRVQVGAVQPNLVAAIHPSVLRQILITAIGRVARYTPPGQIVVFARLEDGNVKITVTSTMAAEDRLTEMDLIRDIPVPENVSVEAHLDGEFAFLWVELPSVGKITVLVVDDNLDMARFYRRSTEGTSYHIVHILEGHSLFESIETTTPDVIVLDVMLSDVDGWELLMRLRQDPATRSIPVIVCSVVREEELALSLGAALYLAKPVRPRQFIQALDQARRPALTGVPKPPANSAAAC